MRTIAVVNQKGGAGKTTLATNLAAAAHLSGHRTLLLDLDPQATAVDWYHARSDESKLAGLNVMSFDARLKPNQYKHLSAGYDVVVIDTPPKLDVSVHDPKARCELLAAACLADAVVVPVEPAYFNLWACDNTFTV
ncbi:MAG: AAA family ATPase, partial [Proteobacteria bacterium]|nr:AAA family ATPase [Pseudomonadota bacterium]